MGKKLSRIPWKRRRRQEIVVKPIIFAMRGGGAREPVVLYERGVATHGKPVIHVISNAERARGIELLGPSTAAFDYLVVDTEP